MTFSVEIEDVDQVKHQGHSVEIFVDSTELRCLIDRLTMLLEHENVDHLHFMSDSWGGDELTEQVHRDDNVLTHHLQIYLVEP